MQHLFTRLLALLLALAAAPLGLRAQTAADSLHQQLDYALAPLDKTQLPAVSPPVASAMPIPSPRWNK